MALSCTPMMKQYHEIKSQHPNEILFFRLGDFYEMFLEDAELASRELEITLTSRDGGQSSRIPMCGVPYHAAEGYIARLINKGYRIAICEQVEDPKSVKGIVRREVVKIITPGTVLSEALLSDKSNNFLAVLYESDDTLSIAAADISTAECIWASFSGASRLSELCDQLFRLQPAEIVLAGSIKNNEKTVEFIKNRISHCTYTKMESDDLNRVQQLTKQHFIPEEIPDCSAAVTAVGFLLQYLHTTVKTSLTHINKLIKYNATDYLIVDSTTLRNLEITRNMRDGSKKGTLLQVLDFTKTAMGSRMMKKWLEYPLINPSSITMRQDAIAELLDKSVIRQEVQKNLTNVYDFERILTRIEVGTANARDLKALQVSLAVLPNIKGYLQNSHSKLLNSIGFSIEPQDDIVELIKSAIVDTPPISVREGGMIRSDYNPELDQVRAMAYDSKKWVQDLETAERESTGIRSLKVGFNRVFGYYIEITHTHSAAVPERYIRKQTLTNAERYITPELKEFESKILGAQERIVSLEYQLFVAIRDSVRNRIKELQKAARQIANLDCIVSLSEAALRYNYTRPIINCEKQIIIKDGRHPVVERLLVRDLFIPNDVELNHHDCEVMVITGPNMAGKSTYMRQVALLVLMAQVGCFIPARTATIGPVDRIFTRVGASDDLATGQSTFMVEMNEVAQILKYGTQNSLIILDEIGRGTSTFDGMSIARAVIEHIKQRIKAKTLFATHYHELTELADHHGGIKNYSVAVKERGNEVVFLRRIITGGADKSYGIHVAQLAGLPQRVIKRAKELLNELEHSPRSTATALEEAAATTAAEPISLFTRSIIDEMIAIDIMSITPLEAINILHRLQSQAKQEVGRS